MDPYQRVVKNIYFIRMCPSLNVHKDMKMSVMKKAPAKPPLECEQCGIFLVNKYVLKRHVSRVLCKFFMAGTGYHLYSTLHLI